MNIVIVDRSELKLCKHIFSRIFFLSFDTTKMWTFVLLFIFGLVFALVKKIWRLERPWTSKNIPGGDPNFQTYLAAGNFGGSFFFTSGGKIWALPKFPAANPTCKPTSPPGILADPKFYLGVRTFHG